MTKSLITVEAFESLLDVAQDMKRYHLRHIPVVDEGRLLGLLSHRDLLRLSASRLNSTPLQKRRGNLEQEKTFAAEVMTDGVETARPEDSVQHAARKMILGRFGCLPVVDDAMKLVGIVSEIDLLRVLAELPPAERRSEPPDIAS